jgi:predicted NBD/HSP70 family sugar kinase
LTTKGLYSTRSAMPREKGTKPIPLQIRTATPSSIRAVNRSILLELIRRRQPLSRAELARLTGIFRSSVSDIVDELLADNLITEERGAPLQRGRVPVSLRLNDVSYPVLGLNIRPSYCQIAWAGLNGRIHNSFVFDTPTSPKKLVQAFGQAVKRLRAEANLKHCGEFRRIGIAIPGHVDAPTGRILWTPTHRELSNFPIADEMEAHTGIPTYADNDCNVGALSELWLSSGEDRTDFIFLNVSDFGTGAGVVINREIYRGHDAHFAAEFGHMIVEPSGPACRCGRSGCWEMFVSNEATWRRMNPESPFTIESFEDMLSAAREGDGRALESFHETARYLSLGISNMGFAFNPAEVIIAGRITAIWELLSNTITTRYGSPHLSHAIRPARLSADDSLLHGAVCLALRDTFARPQFGELPASGRRSA